MTGETFDAVFFTEKITTPPATKLVPNDVTYKIIKFTKH